MIVKGVRLGTGGIAIGTVQAAPGPSQGAVLDTFTEPGSGLIPLTFHTPDIDPVGGGWEDLSDIGFPGELNIDAATDSIVEPPGDDTFYGDRIEISGFSDSRATIELDINILSVNTMSIGTTVSCLTADTLVPPFSAPTGYNVVVMHFSGQIVALSQILVSGAVASQAIASVPSTVGVHTVRGSWDGSTHVIDIDGSVQSAVDSNVIPLNWAGISIRRNAGAPDAMRVNRLEFRP